MKKVILLCMVLFLIFNAGCTKRGEAVLDPSAEEQQKVVEEQEEQAEQKDGPEELPVLAEPELPGAVMVMVDNYWKARPQSGLDKADIVYEIIAEMGITRYMGIFYHESADEIGPVRSARYYFVQLACGYDLPLAHAGGSAEALNMLVELKIKDLDEIYNAGPYFWRDKARKMPHNLYTNTDKLIKGAQTKKYTTKPLKDFPWAKTWEGIDASKIGLDYSSGNYDYIVTWNYLDGRYRRNINGEPHVMLDGAAIAADNLMVLTMKTKGIVKEGVVLSEVEIIGEGQASYFIEGKRIDGKWSKPKADTEIEFFDNMGKKMSFKPGKTWIQVIPDISKLQVS